ncbi:hypothetical protein VTP01DRAFT_5223 [Rhizomucor pusillus]|uniref:uncharacterized protein n=1 Tax=Rhizomucor pusillus TaxID=4840 RepID=UPI003742811C
MIPFFSVLISPFDIFSSFYPYIKENKDLLCIPLPRSFSFPTTFTKYIEYYLVLFVQPVSIVTFLNWLDITTRSLVISVGWPNSTKPE